MKWGRAIHFYRSNALCPLCCSVASMVARWRCTIEWVMRRDDECSYDLYRPSHNAEIWLNAGYAIVLFHNNSVKLVDCQLMHTRTCQQNFPEYQWHLTQAVSFVLMYNFITVKRAYFNCWFLNSTSIHLSIYPFLSLSLSKSIIPSYSTVSRISRKSCSSCECPRAFARASHVKPCDNKSIPPPKKNGVCLFWC